MSFVCIDIDGTCYDLLGNIKKYLATKSIDFKPEKVTKYNFMGDIGCTREDVFSALRVAETYNDLQPYENIIPAINSLKAKGFVTEAYTGSVNDEVIKSMRRNLCESCGLIPNVYVGKKPVFLDAEAVFDDNLDVHKDWIDLGYTGKLYLVNQTYNSVENNPDYPYFDRLIRCSSFADAVNKFLENY